MPSVARRPAAGVPRSPVAVQCSPTGRRVTCSYAGGDTHVQDTASGATLLVFSQKRSPDSVALSPDGVLAATAEESGFELRQVFSGVRVLAINEPYAYERFAFSQDGYLLAVAANYQIKVFELPTCELVRTIQDRACSERQGGMAFSPSTRLLAVGTTSGINLHDPFAGELVARIPQDGNAQTITMKFSPDGSQLATGNSNSTVLVWDVD